MLDPAITISDLRPEDEAAIRQAATLLRDAFPDWLPTEAAALDEVREALAPGNVCLAAWADGEVAGWIGGRPEYSHAWELHPLVVRADGRRRGIGRRLVEALEERARTSGALTLYLGTDDDGPTPGTSVGGIDLFPDPLTHAARLQPIDHASGFYRRLGFVVTGLIPDANGPGKPDILMAKRLQPPRFNGKDQRTNAEATQPVP